MFIKEVLELMEGVHDLHNFKAIFMSGIPGSGKSYIARQFFGHSHLRNINIDSFIELLSARYNRNTDYGDKSLKKKTESLMFKRLKMFVASNNGILIDTTGGDISKMRKTVAILEILGYDCANVYVYANLATAKERNNSRTRHADEWFINSLHNNADENIKNLQHLFGQNFYFVDNTIPETANQKKYIEHKQFAEWKKINKFLNAPAINQT